MTNLRNLETIITIGDSGTLTGKNCDNWHGCHKRDGRLHCVALTDTAVIIGLCTNLIIMKRAHQKGHQVTSEGEDLILKKSSTIIRPVNKITSNGGKIFLLTIKFCKSTNETTILRPHQWKTEDKAYVDPDGVTVKKQ